jgi:bacillithiol biosynthesis cysteine-adding enzyme BshC
VPLTADCYPITVAPGLHRLFLDFCAGNPAAQPFLGLPPSGDRWAAGAAPVPAHRAELVNLLAAQNPSPSAAPALAALASGAGIVVTGQQVALFGGPLFTPFKAATALARARQATEAGRPHVAIFWLASEDHDFAEINHYTFPDGNVARKLVYSAEPNVPRPVGGIVLGDEIVSLVEQAGQLVFEDSLDALTSSWRPGRTFAQAFGDYYSKAFAAQGLLVLDAAGREFHRMGAPVLRAAVEGADELHGALVERNRALESAGYEAQVAVAPNSSLLFLIDDRTGARLALKRQAPSAQEPSGLWQAGRQSYSTADLLGILDTEPERISPSALLRPVFQDFLLSTSLMIGGPAEVAYFAQSAVVYERILGRQTSIQPRLSATLIPPAIGLHLRHYELTLDRIFGKSADGLAQLLAARAMPVEGKQKLAGAGNALDGELNAVLEWMHALDAGLGRSADTAASKMRYQMNRLRRLAANFQLQRETKLGRHAQEIVNALYPGGVMQERVYGAAYYFMVYGFGLAEDLVVQAENPCPGHMGLWL